MTFGLPERDRSDMPGIKFDAVRTDEEVDDLLDRVSEQKEKGETKYAGEAYEDGIRYTIAWLRGESDEDPME